MSRVISFALALLLATLTAASANAQSSANIVIKNVNIIDGTDGPMQRRAHVVIDDGLIADIITDKPAPDATVMIDGAGKYLIPGLIDSNVHNTVYGKPQRRDTVAKYVHRNEELALESAQRHLKYGVTTVRDSYGYLPALIAVRDQIEAGEAIGARILAAGNIVGWGGPFSVTFSLTSEDELTLFLERWNDEMTQGVGEELGDLTPDELRDAINAYLDKGPDFIKYGGSAHFRRPVLIGFSPRAQKVIVEETHKRGLIAETHATSAESLRLAVEAGIDFIQHPEILSRAYPDDLIDLIIEKDVICGIRANVLSGAYWRNHMGRRTAALNKYKNAPQPKTSAEAYRRADESEDDMHLHRENAERLIEAGCAVSIATDNYQGDAPEFRRTPKPLEQEAGHGSLAAVIGLVELGLTPQQAIIAGTKNGARAAGMEEMIGTIKPGKVADLVLLEANPLRDIRNIKRIDTVIARGKVIDRNALPEQRIFYTEP